jgi:hypothetical protein
MDAGEKEKDGGDAVQNQCCTQTWTNRCPKSVVAHGPDDDLKHHRVVSFFFDHVHDLEGLVIKHEDGKMEKIQGFGVVSVNDAWKPIGAASGVYAGKFTGYDCDPHKIVMDIFSAAVLGYHGNLSVAKSFVKLEAGFGGVDSVTVEYDPIDNWEDFVVEVIESASTARESCKAEAMKAKREVEARHDSLSVFMRKLTLEKKKVENGKKPKPKPAAIENPGAD